MRKILLVEDHAPLREKTARQLERRGFLVLMASDGRQALTLAVESKPQLILLDMSLPGINGYETARQLKANPATNGIPIIAMTLFKSNSEREKCLKAGCDDSIAKPYQLFQLMQQIQACLATVDLVSVPVRNQRASGHHILVVDDYELNRSYLSRWLSLQGHLVTLAENGLVALECLHREPFDLVLLDIMMPGLDGYGVLKEIKSSPVTKDLPVIMISAIQEMDSVVRCIEGGAEDYLPKPFNPVLLRARIDACLEKKKLRDKEKQTWLALLENQELLAAELSEAAVYVRSLLPPPLRGEVRTDWHFIPSTQLGGDAFGYQWLDESHFALFLLDVRGHGVGAAMLSISVMNLLRSQTLLAADLHDPAAVLSALNNKFQMDTQNERFFTIWYGVYDKLERRLTYASGGHPPSVLIKPESEGASTVDVLRQPGGGIGIIANAQFSNAIRIVPPGSRLFVFSDGAFEIFTEEGRILTMEQFIQTLKDSLTQNIQPPLEFILSEARRWRGEEHFDDDYSIVLVNY